ncbi:MAG: membrane integrity-associated transporter subunit PqiC [Deltaproteobacteria bacterium]|nr:MAG: membrane integrity-associated transporter subunit PqiC [Deltaproteobacteria bacterium]
MRRTAGRLLATAVALVALGCLTQKPPEKRRYVFDARREAPAATREGVGVLRIDRIRVSPLFERKGFVYRTGESSFESDFYNEFYAPPGVLLRQALLAWLGPSSTFASVSDSTNPGDATWLLEGQVDNLYGDLRDPRDPRAVLEIEFALLYAKSLNVRFRKSYAASVQAEDTSAPAIMAAWNEALAAILAELEGDLRARRAR